jgi:hypothetical protein
MHRVFKSSVRGVLAVAVIVMLSTSAVAAPRENVDRERGRRSSVVQIVKRIIQALGDGLTVPVGNPKP